MKKVFLSLATIAIVASGSLTVTSCGSDDSTTTPPVVNPPVAQDIKLALTTNPADIFEGEAFELTIKKADGSPITGAVLHVDGTATTITSTDGVFRIQGPAGEITLTAVYEGKTSNEVPVTVQAAQVTPSEGTGTFEFEGTTYNIEDSTIFFTGLAYADATQTTVISRWQIESNSGDHTAIVTFITPATPAGGDQYTIEMPNATNTTGRIAGVLLNGTAVGQVNTNVKVDFSAATVSLTNKICDGKYTGTSDAINDNPFSLTFDGKTPVARSTAKGAKGVSGFVQAGTKVKAENLQVISNKLIKM